MAQIENRTIHDFSALGSGGPRRRFSHLYTQSIPAHTHTLALPLPSPSLTLTSRSSDSESTLTTPQFGYHDTYGSSLTLKIADGTESPSDIEPEFDIPTPKPKTSPKASSRIPIRIRTAGIRPRPRSCSHSTITQSSFKKAGDLRDSLRTALLARTTKALSRSKPTLALSLTSPLRNTPASYMGQRIDGKLDLDRRYADGKGNQKSGASESASPQRYGHGDDFPCPWTSSPALPASSQFQPSYAPSKSMSMNNMSPTKPLLVSTSVSPSERILRSTLVRDEQRSTPPPLSQSHRRRHSSAVAPVVHSPPPLKPHEQILRARLERVLVNADPRSGRARAGSDTSLLGWLWRGEDDDDDDDDEMFQLPSPLSAPPNIQTFSQIQSHRKTPRLHTRSQPSSYVSDFKIIQAHSPQPRHAHSLGVLPNVSDLAVETRDNTSSSNASKMPTPPPTPPPRLAGRHRSASVNARNTSAGNKTQAKGSSGSPTRSQDTRSPRNRSYTQSYPDPESIPRPPKTVSGRDHVPRTSPMVPSIPPSTSISEPTSPSATKFNYSQIDRFNADTASIQCRQIDGYVSFAAVAGLKEPGLQDGIDEDHSAGGHRGNGGWVGRLFGR